MKDLNLLPAILILTSVENFCCCMGILVVKHATPHLQSETLQLSNSCTNMVLSDRMKRILYIEVMRQTVYYRTKLSPVAFVP